ncbi:hypothetical protein, unlikely [Trypanosoma congolense IL3000]|uniref:Uncharacterized protein n=1 Tax=Trypanosoma congolense (strain IL3000) TaxID=1068625 RepID=F9W4H2_TRYCI|nr:hypothetical protein, unlikely [Trypanosoma congolense IL3000]
MLQALHSLFFLSQEFPSLPLRGPMNLITLTAVADRTHIFNATPPTHQLYKNPRNIASIINPAVLLTDKGKTQNFQHVRQFPGSGMKVAGEAPANIHPAVEQWGERIPVTEYTTLIHKLAHIPRSISS